MSRQSTEACALLLFVVLRSCVSKSDQGNTIKEVKVLSDGLMENYSKHIFPTESNYLNVTIAMKPQTLSNLDEIDEKLSTVIWFQYLWKDESIVWNKEETKIEFITLGWNDVWKPFLQLMNPQTDSVNKPYCDRSYDSVIYANDGTAYYEELMTTRTACDLDMSYYPFDVQSCEIKMKIAGSTNFVFKLEVIINTEFSIEDAQHGSWKLTTYGVSLDPYNSGGFVINLNFERRPLFILLNIILPLLILALLTPAVFLLPKKSGERVGFAVAMLLAISVYMTIVSAHLPHNSKPAPLMPIMIFVWYSFDALVVLVVIVNTKIYLIGADKRMPTILRQFVMLTQIISCQKRRIITDIATSGEIQRCIEIENANGKEETERGEDMDTDLHPTVTVTWQELSHAIDKWFFVISYLLKIALPAIFLTIMKIRSQN